MIEETRRETHYVIARDVHQAINRLNSLDDADVTVFDDPQQALEIVTDSYRFYHGYPIFEVTLEVKRWGTSST